MITLERAREFAEAFGDKPAVIEGEETITWRTFAQMIQNYVDSLLVEHQAQGFGRVVYISENSWQLVVAMSAFATLKIPFAGIDYTGSVEKKAHCIEAVGADCVVYAPQFAEEADKATDDLEVKKISLDAAFSDLARTPEAPVSLEEARGREYEALAFTSGTSGLPKVVHRTKSFEKRRFDTLISKYGFDSHDRFLVTLPFYHVSAPGWARMFLNLGATIVLGKTDRPYLMAEDLIAHRITALLIVPPVLEKVVEAFENETMSLDARDLCVKFVVVGGKHFPVDLKSRATQIFGDVIREYYGTTETGLNVIGEPEDMRVYPKSSGFPMEGSEVAILDEDGSEVAPGEVGRVAISSYQNMDGYLGIETNAHVLGGELYLPTPDYGHLDEEGRLFLICRSDISGAATAARWINVYELEDQIREHPKVQDVFVVPEEQADGKTRLVCTITLKDGFLESNVIEELEEQLRPLRGYDPQVFVVQEIPHSLSGKVDRQALRNLMKAT